MAIRVCSFCLTGGSWFVTDIYLVVWCVLMCAGVVSYDLSAGILVDENLEDTTVHTPIRFNLHPSSNVVVNVTVTQLPVNFSGNLNFTVYKEHRDILLLLYEKHLTGRGTCVRHTNTIEELCNPSSPNISGHTTTENTHLMCAQTFYIESGLFHVTHARDSSVYFRTESWVIARAVWEIVARAEWEVVYVITDDCSEKTADAILGVLSDHHKRTTYHVLKPSQTDADILCMFSNIYALRKHQQMNILVVCGEECVLRVLQLANQFDNYRDNQTALYMFARFLIVSSTREPPSDGSPIPDVVSKILGTVQQLDNVVVLRESDRRVQNARTDKQQVLHESLFEVFKEVNRKYKGTRLTQSQMVTDLKEQLSSDLTSPDFDISTALWTLDQSGSRNRSFERVGTWSKIEGLMMSSSLFPNSMLGFNGRHYDIATELWPPFVNIEKVNGKDKYVGLTMRLLEEMALSLNFTYTLVRPPDGTFGALDNTTGKWTGLVGMLQTKKAFAVFAALGATADRNEVSDFAMPYYYDHYSVFLVRPNPDASKWKTLLTIYSWPALVAILASLPVMAIIVYLLERANPYNTVRITDEKDWPYRKLLNVFWYMYGVLLNQGGIHMPSSWTGRIVIISWWMFSIIVTVTFSGNLIASITVNKETNPFNTLTEMAAQGEYNYGTLGGALMETILRNNKARKEYARVWRGIEKDNSDEVLNRDHDDHIKRLLNTKYAYISDKIGMMSFMSNHCEIMQIKQEFQTLEYSVSLQQETPYLSMINNEMMRILEGGLIQIWKQQFWLQKNFCSTNTSRKPTDSVTLLDVQSAFYVLFIGVVLAILTLFGEKIIPYCYGFSQRWTVTSTSVDATLSHCDTELNYVSENYVTIIDDGVNPCNNSSGSVEQTGV